MALHRRRPGESISEERERLKGGSRHQRLPGESVKEERERLKKTMAQRGSSHGSSHAEDEPFKAKTFQGKVRNLMANRSFHPGESRERRMKLARGRVASTLRARGELR